MRRRKSEVKNILIGLIFLAIVFMTAGYAAYSRDLIINGTGKILSDWDIRFSDITLNHTRSTLQEDGLGDAMELVAPEISTDGITLTVNIALVHITDKVVYDIDITNYSELFDAEFKGTTISTDVDTDYILYDIEGLTFGDKIAADSSGGISPNKKTVALTAYWNQTKTEKPTGVTADPETTYTETATITFVFEAA